MTMLDEFNFACDEYRIAPEPEPVKELWVCWHGAWNVRPNTFDTEAAALVWYDHGIGGWSPPILMREVREPESFNHLGGETVPHTSDAERNAVIKECAAHLGRLGYIDATAALRKLKRGPE